jgi:recombinational DNA repair protein RecT
MSEKQTSLDDYAPDFVKESETAKKEQAQQQEAQEQPEAPEAPEDEQESKAITPQQKSQDVTKRLIRDQAMTQFIDSASNIVNLTSKLDTEVARRLMFFALNRTETALQDHYPKPVAWSQINQRKLVSALANAALLELDAEQGEVYPILYKDGTVKIQGKDYDRYAVNMQRGYKGERKVRLKYAMRPLLDMDARLIREGDTFTVHTTALSDEFEFDHDPFNTGKVKGAFAWVVREDGTKRVKVLTMEDLEKRRQASMEKMGGKLSPAWKKWENEMYLAKTLLAAAKDIPVEIKDTAIADAYADTDYESVDVVEIESEKAPRLDPKALSKGKHVIGQEA